MADRAAASLFRPRPLLAALLAVGTVPVLWAQDSGSLQAHGARNACGLEVSDVNYCKECGPCGQGEGRCVTDDECQPGLACVEDFGAAFGFAPTLDVCIAPGSLAPSYSVVELPSSVEAGGYLLDDVVGLGINNAGQVVGAASNSDYVDYRSVAFRYDIETGMEVLDAGGGQWSKGLLVNENGDVYGLYLFPGTPYQRAFFIYQDGRGFNRLKLGVEGFIKRRFSVTDMNDDGDLLGTVFLPGERRNVPYLFTFEDGWQSLEGLAPALRQLSAVGGRINNRGDMVFGGCNRQKRCPVYLWRGGKLVELKVGGFESVATDLNDRGDVVGSYLVTWTEGHAFYYQAGKRRFLEVRPRAYRQSSARIVTRKGVVAGELGEETSLDTLYTFDPRRKNARQVVARKADFEALLPAGMALKRIGTFFVNERLEMVGMVYGTRISDEVPAVNRWFYFSQPLGVLDIQEMVTAAGSPRTVLTVQGLNDRGAIVVTYRQEESHGLRNRSLVLVPEGF